MCAAGTTEIAHEKMQQLAQNTYLCSKVLKTMSKLPIYFAPLQGYTEDVYRRIHQEMAGGITAYYTPFIRLEHGEMRSKDLRDIRPEFNTGVPVVPQVIARDGAEMAKLMEYIKPLGYKRIDINMGCPFPLQTRHGRGCGILQHPDKVAEIMEVVKQHGDNQFSVKMRLGLEQNDEWKAVLPILNAAPLCQITLHPRIGTQQYKGTIDRDSFAAFRQECQHPLVYNGDILTVEDLRKLQQEYPDLAGVMIGRGLLARPTMAYEYQNDTEFTSQKVLQVIRDMHARMLAHYEQIIPGESQRLNKVRSFWDYMEETLGRKAWKKVMKAGNLKNYLEAVRAL